MKAKRFFAVIVGLLFMATAVQAAEDSVLTLTDAVSKGINTNPEYGVADSQKKAQQQRLVQARGSYFPSIDLTAQTGPEREEATGIQSDTLWRQYGSLSLTQLLFDGFQTKYEVESQRQLVASAGHRLDERGDLLGLDIVQAYLDVQRQRKLLKIAQKNVSDHNNLLGKIREAANAGTSTEGDASQASSRLQGARANQVQVEQDLRFAEALFLQKVGELPHNLTPADVPRSQLAKTVEESISNAIKNSPSLAAYETDILSAKADRDGAASGFYPHVNLELAGSNGHNLDGVRGDQDNYSAMAVARWNLFRGGADEGRRREFIYRYAETAERASVVRRQIEKDVRDTWFAREAATKRVKEFLAQARADERVVSVYMDQFTINRRSLLDVLDAQNSLFISRANHLNAVFTEEFAVYRLLALEGRILPALGIQIEGKS